MKILFELDTDDQQIRQKMKELKEIERIIEERSNEISNKSTEESWKKSRIWLKSLPEKSF